MPDDRYRPNSTQLLWSRHLLRRRDEILKGTVRDCEDAIAELLTLKVKVQEIQNSRGIFGAFDPVRIQNALCRVVRDLGTLIEYRGLGVGNPERTPPPVKRNSANRLVLPNGAERN